MSKISPLAYIHPEAVIGENCEIGAFCYIDKGVIIGDNNKISNSIIAGNISSSETMKKKTFFERHPVICGLLISLSAGIVLLFSFWTKIIEFIERLF